MTDIDRRMAMFIGRTTHEAWLQLQRMQAHPKFDELLTELERLAGTVTDKDVDKAARKILDKKD